MLRVALFIFVLLPLSLSADIGTMAVLKLQINMTNGDQKIKYMQMVDYPSMEDSLRSENFIRERIIGYSLWKDSISVYNQGIPFSYPNDWGDKDTIPLIKLSQPERMSIKQVKSIKVLKIHRMSAAVGIPNALTPRDTTWMKEKPYRLVKLGAIGCSYDIFVFENDPFIWEVIARIKQLCDRATDLVDDNEIFDFIRKVGRQKMVIVTFCTC